MLRFKHWMTDFSLWDNFIDRTEDSRQVNGWEIIKNDWIQSWAPMGNLTHTWTYTTPQNPEYVILLSVYKMLKNVVYWKLPFLVYSLIQFFSKMKKWSDMSSLSQDFRNRIRRLERNFEVSTVIFRKFEPIFMDMFQDPQGEPPRQPRSRKHRWDLFLSPICAGSDWKHHMTSNPGVFPWEAVYVSERVFEGVNAMGFKAAILLFRLLSFITNSKTHSPCSIANQCKWLWLHPSMKCQ